jgi:hypothetical protein
MPSTCACEVPAVACRRREVPAISVIFAIICTRCGSAGQSEHSFDHAFMVLRHGSCKPPTIEAP